MDCGGGVLDGIGQEVQCVDNSVFRSDLWLGEVFVEYLNIVGDDDGFGCCVDVLEAAVLIEGRSDGETFAAAEVPRSAGTWLVMDDYWASKGARGVASKLKGPLKCSQA